VAITAIAEPAIDLIRYGPAFPAANGAATISKESEEALLRSGWIVIGWLDVHVPVLDCTRGPAPCQPIPGEDADAMLRREAGQIGGERVTLIRSREQQNQAVCGSSFGGGCSVVGSRVMDRIMGSVWRRVPELAPLRLLLYAAEHGDLGTVNRLLDQKVDPDTFDPRLGRAPLHVAALNGHAEVVAALLRHHARIELVDAAGYTPLGYAAFIEPPTPFRCRAASVLRRAGAKEPPTPNHGNPIDFPPPGRCPR
jgi:hypothetical protein